ncbi:MAG: transcriptional repressor [Pacificimonas sp.]
MSEHKEYSGAALATAAEQAMVGAGERWTDMRAQVFDALRAVKGPASAYDIADAVTAARGKRVAPNSIYRILDLFVANNVAKRVETENAYIANTHPACAHDCIFIICDDCGRIEHHDDDVLAASMRSVASASGFHTPKPVMEVRGRCDRCVA